MADQKTDRSSPEKVIEKRQIKENRIAQKKARHAVRVAEKKSEELRAEQLTLYEKNAIFTKFVSEENAILESRTLRFPGSLITDELVAAFENLKAMP